MTSFLTIGHSNRSLDELIEMLHAAQVSLLVDVRTLPRSRANPVFNIDTLPAGLAKAQIGYEHYAALGGLRSRQRDVDEQTNGFWHERSFHNYADYALTAAFAAALQQLIAAGRQQRLAIMCSEAVWWRCHRRIITDYLLANGHTVDHLMSPGRTEPATMSPGAIPSPDGKVTYPAPVS